MNSVNKTLYIPLYGKSYVSAKGLFLKDEKAEEIWESERFHLKGKSKSKWLAYYMGIRATVFDNWLKQKMSETPDTVVIHIGCGMDSRILRVGDIYHRWYDIDLPEVIIERKKYYSESANYQMLAGDASNCIWLENIPETKHTIIVMEGVSMYLPQKDLISLIANLSNHFDQLTLLVDCYTTMAAKMTKYKNPINDVGVTDVCGIDDPLVLQNGEFAFVKEHNMTPKQYINELKGLEKFIFEKLYAGSFAKKLYRLFEYRKI